MKLTPLGDRVVLKQLEAETTTKSGIVLTTATQEKTTGSRSCCSWTWNRRCEDGSFCRTESYLF